MTHDPYDMIGLARMRREEIMRQIAHERLAAQARSQGQARAESSSVRAWLALLVSRSASMPKGEAT